MEFALSQKFTTFVVCKIEQNSAVMKRFIFSSIVLALAVVVASAQTSVVPVDQAVANDVVTYFLPKTELVVVANVAQTVRKAGPFCKYAERYLGVDDVIVADDSAWQLESVALHSRMVADAGKCYAIAVNKKTTAYNIRTNNHGVIQSVNQTVEPQKTTSSKPKKSCQCDTLTDFDLSCLGEEALVATSIPKMAEMAAKQIYQIRENRANLLSGENEQLPDGAALRLMLQRLDETEAKLLALFVGRTAVCHKKVQFSFAPTAAVSDSVLFRMSRYEGIVEADDLAGEPIYLTIEMTSQQSDNQQNANKEKSHGLFYNVPATMRVRVSDGEHIFTEKSLVMPQFGTVRSLPASLFDGQNTCVEFNRLGGIKSISK